MDESKIVSPQTSIMNNPMEADRQTPPMPSNNIETNPMANLAEVVESNTGDVSMANEPIAYTTPERILMDKRESRVRAVMGKARQVINSVIGNAVGKGKEWLRPTPKKGIVLGSLALAGAGGVTIKKMRSHS